MDLAGPDTPERAAHRFNLFWPLAAEGRIGRPFGSVWKEERSCDGRWKRHTGVDIVVPAGTPVLAAAAGEVKFSSSECIVIEHDHLGRQYTTVYWHVLVDAQTADLVDAGDEIGQVADNGTDTRLHFGVREDAYSPVSQQRALPRSMDCGADEPRFPGQFINPVRHIQYDQRLAALIAAGGLRAACTYADATDLPQYKANLHCHSNHSDGYRHCDQVAAWYEAQGFDILAMSDHNAGGDQNGGIGDEDSCTQCPGVDPDECIHDFWLCNRYDHRGWQEDHDVHDWDGDQATHDWEYSSGREAYVRDYSSPCPFEWVPPERNWKLNRPGEFVVLNSVEWTGRYDPALYDGRPLHTNFIEFPPGDIPGAHGWQEHTIDPLIAQCHANGGFVFLNHPRWISYGPALDPDEVVSLADQLDGLEVLNAALALHPDDYQDSRGPADEHWNACLDAGKRLWGFANDDGHAIESLAHFRETGKAWNMVWCTGLTKEAVMDSLRRGAFYASCGIVVDRVKVTARSITVHSRNATHARVISDGGRMVARTRGRGITYHLSGRENWIRVELWNNRKLYPDVELTQKAWLQPIMVGSLIDG